MNSFLRVSMIMGITISILSYSNGLAGDQTDKWQQASRNMVYGLKHGPDGLRQSILQNIIRYSDRLQVNDAVFEVMGIYRHHPDERVRQLALVALSKMHSNWVIAHLERSVKFEKSPKLRKTICAILHQCKRPVPIDEVLLIVNK